MARDANRAAEFLAISDRFTRAFPAPQAEPPLLAAQRANVGPIAVARATRRAIGASLSLPERIAGVGVRTRVEAIQAQPEQGPRWVDASSPAALVCEALQLLSEGRTETLLVGPRTAPHLPQLREVLAPQLDAQDLSLAIDERADRPAFARACFVVAPFYYLKGELHRIAQQIAVERALPCPEAEAGATLLLPRSWDQRAVLLAAIEQSLNDLKLPCLPREMSVVELEAANALETLEAAREQVGDAPPSIAAFVYPMWREQAAVEQALHTLLAKTSRATIDERPSAIWGLGLGAVRGRVLLDSDQRLRVTNTRRALDRRQRFEAEPSIPRAMGVLASRWLGL